MSLRVSDYSGLRAVVGSMVLIVLAYGPPAGGQEIQKNGAYQQATMSYEDDTLTVDTGVIRRQWKLTKHGLATVSLKHGAEEYCQVAEPAEETCDWELGAEGEAQLVSLTAEQADDEHFTSRHLRVVAELVYPDDQLRVKYAVWAYPSAPGLRTQLSLKRLTGAGPARVARASRPTFEVIRGNPFTAPGSIKVVGKPLASNLHHDKAVELHAKGLDSQQKYILGVSWWDWGGGGRKQRLRVTSVDGEANHMIIPATLLPGWKGKQQMPAELTAEVPGEVMLDDTFRIFVDKLVGPNANVSEVWLYQSGRESGNANLPAGPADRIKTLVARAPAGYRLVAYLDAGGQSVETSRQNPVAARVDYLPIAPRWNQRQAFGLMQGIKTNMKEKILKEADISAAQTTVDWANGVILRSNDRGVIVVKESNKHIALRKEDDVATGGFRLQDSHVTVTGAGFFPDDVKQGSYTKCWATWVVLYQGDPWDGNLALKQFDRFRYPIDPQRDMYIMANTWGTEDKRPPCLHAAREENVLRELESVADLGIDVLQIDDGWQTPQWTTAVSARQVQRGEGALQVFGDYAVYPDGWNRVREKAERLGVTLGLWAAWTAPTDALQKNYDLGDFKYFKLDFALLNTKNKYDGLARKARELIKHSNYSARVNWDVTEIATRMGYFSGREYGNIYLANRKTRTVRHPVLYVPYKVLNDAWNLSKYVNLNKFQVTVQNVDNVLPDVRTDAAQHSHDYAVGIALMSSPIFFQETRYYEGAARERIRKILSVYKKHRAAMYEGYVFPIGDEPDNHSWTGFQNHNPQTGGGYLTLFRERLNQSTSQTLRLRFVKGAKLRISNLLTGESTLQRVDESGAMEATMAEAPGFLFLRYEAP
ncbi:MAG: hypothetical protein MI725_12370 [Pirellulales bacterium]|nr:hypothetical protein [Pirellulales bacterium]